MERIPGQAAMLRDLGLMAEGEEWPDLPVPDTVFACLVKVWERQHRQDARLDRLEAALEQVWPGWDAGSHAPWCKGSCCDMG